MDEQVAQFTGLTDASSEVAQYYLVASKGDVGEAVERYFQAQEEGNDSSADAAQSGPRTLSGARASPMPESWGRGGGSRNGSGSNSGTSTPSGRKGLPANAGPKIQSFSELRNAGSSSNNARPSGRGNITSFSELQRSGGTTSGSAARSGGRPHSSDDDEDDTADDPLNFFAGGERSALAVQNPDHGRRRAGEAPSAVNDILRQAEAEGREMQQGGPSQLSQGSAAWFGGRGRTVADEGEEEDAGEDREEDVDTDDPSDTVVTRTITFWANGFSIGSGPLLSYDDPRHQQVLEAIKARRAPLELLDVEFGQQVELRIEKRTQEKYEAPPPASTPFAGTGNRLGSPGPSTPVASSIAAPANATSSNPALPSVTVFEVDSSQPTTQIQLRLADGSRTVGRFNHDHTISDVRRYIDFMAPSPTARAYILQASFPPKPLADESLTLKDAALLNSSIIQKFT